MKILCAIDDRAHSVRAATVAFDLSKKLWADLTLYMANPILPGRGAPVYLWTDEQVERILDDMRSRAHWSGLLNVTCAGRRANRVADSVIAYADHHGMDLIVIGASDRSGAIKALSGSVSRDIVAKANCPIVVVRGIRGQPLQRPRRGIPVTMNLHELAPSASRLCNNVSMAFDRVRTQRGEP